MASEASSRMQQYLEVLEKYNIKEQVMIMRDFCKLSLIFEFLPKWWIRRKLMDQRKDKVSNNLTFIKQIDKNESKDQSRKTLKVEEKGQIRRKKIRWIICCNCRKREHIMKNCRYIPRIMRRKSGVNKKTLSPLNRTLDAIRLLQTHKIMT